jgi:hypothetical protein
MEPGGSSADGEGMIHDLKSYPVMKASDRYQPQPHLSKMHTEVSFYFSGE